MVSAPHRRSTGFTLIEAMVVLAIMAVLAAVATPSMRDIIDVQNARAAHSELFSALTRTRSEAVKRNTEVMLTPTDGSNWALGWRIPNPSAVTSSLEVHSVIKSIHISGPGNVVFTASGRVKGSSTPKFEIKTARGNKRCIEVDVSGRPYQSKSAC